MQPADLCPGHSAGKGQGRLWLPCASWARGMTMACWLQECRHSSPACLCRARHGRPVTGRPGMWGAGVYQHRPSQRLWRPSEDLLSLCSWERKLPFISETQAWLEPRAGGQGARAPPATSLLAQQSSGVNHPAPPEASVGFRMLQPSGLRQMPAF